MKEKNSHAGVEGAANNSYDANESDRSSISGVWRIESRTQGDTILFGAQPNALVIFTDRHYSMTYLVEDKPRRAFAIPWQPDDIEKRERFDSLIVNAGTYEIAGGTLLMRPTVARMPEFVGGWVRCTYRREGDALHLTFTDEYSNDGIQAPWVGRGPGLSLVLVRVE